MVKNKKYIISLFIISLSFISIVNVVNGIEACFYKGTYDFNDEIDGTTNTDINGIYNVYAGVNVEVIGSHLGHKKVINFSVEAGYIYAKMNFNYISQTNGTIELWIKLASDETENFQWQFLSNINSYMTYFTIYFNNIRIYHDGGYTSKIIDTKSNWIHIRLQFNYSTYKISFFINGELIVDDLLMHTQTGIYLYRSRIQINTANTGNMFIDAIGYSWNLFYNIGDNMYCSINIQEIITPILSLIILILLMVLMFIMYIKMRVFLPILVIFLFSLIIGFNSIGIENIPLNPYFSIFFILFQSVIFIETSLDNYNKVQNKKKGY